MPPIAAMIANSYIVRGVRCGMAFDADRLELVPTKLTSARATTAQEFFWTMALDDPDPSAYHMSVAHILQGTDQDVLDRDALRRSLVALVGANGVYRTALREIDGELRQVVLPPDAAPPFELEMVDRAPLPETEWSAEIARTVAELVARGFDFERGKVIWACLTELAPQRHALVIVFHHAVLDHGSSLVFFHRLWELYAAVRRGEPLPDQASLQVVDVADAIARWVKTPTGQAQAAYWKARLGTAPPTMLPLDLPREAVDARRARVRRGIVADLQHPAELVTLDHEVREAVTRVARKYRVSIYGVYLAGLYWLLHQETGQTDLCIESTMDMRLPHPDFAKVLGPLTSWTVLRVDVSGCNSFGEAVPRAGQAVAEAKQNGVIDDYYRVVPHTVRRVVFNYVPTRWLGQPLPGEKEGLVLQRVGLPFPRWKRPWDLHLTIIDAEHACLIWTGNENLFQKATVSALLQKYLHVLETGTRQCL